MKLLPQILLLSAALLGFSSAAHAATFTANIGTLNESGVTGTALLNLSDDMRTLTVTTTATGLEPNQNHVQHIHGAFAAGQVADSMTPTLANDADGDGFVELIEGVPSYGPIVLPLATINTADGNADITTTYDLTDPSVFGTNRATGDPYTVADLTPLTFREIVIHGLSVPAGIGSGTPNEVDGTGGYLAVLPVAAGEIVADEDMASVPEPSAIAALVVMSILGGISIRRRQFPA